MFCIRNLLQQFAVTTFITTVQQHQQNDNNNNALEMERVCSVKSNCNNDNHTNYDQAECEQIVGRNQAHCAGNKYVLERRQAALCRLCRRRCCSSPPLSQRLHAAHFAEDR